MLHVNVVLLSCLACCYAVILLCCYFYFLSKPGMQGGESGAHRKQLFYHGARRLMKGAEAPLPPRRLTYATKYLREQAALPPRRSPSSSAPVDFAAFEANRANLPSAGNVNTHWRDVYRKQKSADLNSSDSARSVFSKDKLSSGSPSKDGPASDDAASKPFNDPAGLPSKHGLSSDTPSKQEQPSHDSRTSQHGPLSDSAQSVTTDTTKTVVSSVSSRAPNPAASKASKANSKRKSVGGLSPLTLEHLNRVLTTHDQS